MVNVIKHIFVVNPMAGTGNAAAMLRRTLSARPKDPENPLVIYETKGEKDATAYVRKVCLAEEGGPFTLRFYACGGDGTLCEVVNGAAGFSQVEVACYPCGSGNDFVKYYGGKEVFLDLENLLQGEAVTIDLMRTEQGYSINVTNFGFDTAVAETMTRVRHKKLIGGKNSYTTGIVKALFTSMRNRCEVSVDGESLGNGRMLLCTVANGRYVGGSFRCAPRSLNDDGLLEVCYVKSLSVFTFLKLLPCYVRGDHLDDPRFRKYLEYRRGREIHVTSPGRFAYTLDGEVIESSDFTIQSVPSALRFVLPKGYQSEEQTTLAKPLAYR